jgi:hypothetical protein
MASARTATRPLADGDRVELTRPLVADAKQVRRPRAAGNRYRRCRAQKETVTPGKQPFALLAPEISATMADARCHGRRRYPLCALSVRSRLPLRRSPARIGRTPFARLVRRGTAGKVWTGAQDVAIYALGLIGVDYRYGGNTPKSGLDCSGLVLPCVPASDRRLAAAHREGNERPRQQDQASD